MSTWKGGPQVVHLEGRTSDTGYEFALRKSSKSELDASSMPFLLLISRLAKASGKPDPGYTYHGVKPARHAHINQIALCRAMFLPACGCIRAANGKVQTRIDPADGNPHTKKCFRQVYKDNNVKWKASPRGPKVNDLQKPERVAFPPSVSIGPRQSLAMR